MMLMRLMRVMALLPALVAGLADVAPAAPLPRCGGQYGASDLYWRTNSPPVSAVLSRLPVGKRHTSGNMMSLNYNVDAKGRIVHRAEFNRQWEYIFGRSTATGYGRLIRGKWMPGARSSWGNSTFFTQKNLSECVVNGIDTAICLGIPSSDSVAPNSLGHHAGWMILDEHSPDPRSLVNLNVGDRACLTYRLMLSSNFDLRTGINAKFPALASSPDGTLPPNDHICDNPKEAYQRIFNRGDRFSTRITINGRNGSETAASALLLSHFKDDMLDVACRNRLRVITEMNAKDPRVNELSRGVWYRVEQEVVMNTNYDPTPGQQSGARNQMWVYDDRTGALMTSFGIANSFNFEGKDYPLMPRSDPSGKINGMFVSMMQTASGKSFKRDFAIAVRGFELYVK